MPWCPQCGSEYREGFRQCPSCGAGLVVEMPLAPRRTPVRRWRPRLRLIGLRHQLERSLRCGREGIGVLRRCPTLLALPLLLVIFNATAWGVGGYLFRYHTRVGRKEAAEFRRDIARSEIAPVRVVRAHELRPTAIAQRGLMDALDSFASPISGPRLDSAVELALTASVPEASLTSLYRAAGRLLPYLWQVLLVLPFSVLILAGFYGVLAGAVSGRGCGWGVFWHCAKRFYARFLLYSVLAYAIFSSIDGLLRLLAWHPPIVYWAIVLIHGLYRTVTPVLAVPIALTLVAVVSDQAPLLLGLRRGIVTLGRGWLTAIVFLAALFVVCRCVAVLQGLMRTQVYAWSPDPI